MKTNNKKIYTKRGPILESRASFSALKDQLKELDGILLSAYEKELEREEKNSDKQKKDKKIEEFILSLEKQRTLLGKMMLSLEKKVSILKDMKEAKEEEYKEALEKGVNIFKNVTLRSFDNLKYKKGQTIMFKNKTYSLIVEKTKDDANVYSVIETNIQGVGPEDILKIDNFSMGENAKMELYRQAGGKYESISKFEMKAVVEVTLDPI